MSFGNRDRSCTAASRVGALCLVVVLTAPAGAGAFSGSATDGGTSRLAVKGCGVQRSPLTTALVVRADGTWSAADQSGDAFAGTGTPVGRGERKLRLAFDDASTAGLVASIVEDIAEACELTGVTVTSVRAKTFLLKLDRTRTRATLVMRYAFKGTAEGESGRATYSVRAQGPWAAD